MLNTTPAISALESIDFALLSDITGGCGKKRCCCPAPAPVQQCQVVMPPMIPPIAPPASAPAPPPESSGPSVSTSVSINGQPAA